MMSIRKSYISLLLTALIMSPLYQAKDEVDQHTVDGERGGTRRVLRRSSSECFQALSDNSRIKISQA
jgi:hypothetical protein